MGAKAITWNSDGSCKQMIGSILVTGDVLMRPVSLLFVRLPLTLSSQLTVDPTKDIKPLSAYLNDLEDTTFNTNAQLN